MAPEDDFTDMGNQFAALTTLFSTGSTFLIRAIIIRVSFDSCWYQGVTQVFGVSECHDWFVLVDVHKLTA